MSSKPLLNRGKRDRIILMGVPGSEFALYKVLLSVLTEPTYLTAIGGFLVAFGAGVLKRLRWIAKALFGALYRAAGGEVTEEVQEGEKVDTRDTHVITIQDVHRNNEIMGRLERLLIKLDCTRVCVLQFHNGETFSLSNPMFRLSTTYEATAPGFASTCSELKNIAVSTIPVFVNALVLPTPDIIPGVKEEKFCPKGGVCELRDTPIRLVSLTTETLKLGRIRISLEKFGVAKMYACVLTAVNGGLLGAMTIHYHADIERADEKMKEHFCEVCKTQQFLNTVLYKKR